jgi:hypothetical protein
MGPSQKDWFINGFPINRFFNFFYDKLSCHISTCMFFVDLVTFSPTQQLTALLSQQVIDLEDTTTTMVMLISAMKHYKSSTILNSNIVAKVKYLFIP